MFYGNTINDTRKLFFSSWEKSQNKEPLLPLEQQIVEVIKDHPEYHKMLESPSFSQEANYFPEMGQTNPFLHMGLHLAIREQLSTNRPSGIQSVYHALVKAQGNPLEVEHLLMERLAECLWQAQRQQSMPDEAAYLTACNDLLANLKKART